MLFKWRCLGGDINYWFWVVYLFSTKGQLQQQKFNPNKCNKVRRFNNKFDQFKPVTHQWRFLPTLLQPGYLSLYHQDSARWLKCLPESSNLLIPWLESRSVAPACRWLLCPCIYTPGNEPPWSTTCKGWCAKGGRKFSQWIFLDLCPIMQSLMVDLVQNPCDICCTGRRNLPWCCGAKSFPFLWVFDGD